MNAHRPTVTFYADGRNIKDNLLSIKLQVYFDKQVFVPLSPLKIGKFTSLQWGIIQDRKVNQGIKNDLSKDRLSEIRKKLDSCMERANAVIDELAAKGVPYSAQDVKDSFYSYTNKSVKRLNFFSLIDELRNIKKDEGRALSTLESYDSTKKSVEGYCAFANIKELKITDIDIVFLRKYEDYMLAGGNSISTVGAYNRNIRAVFNYCINDIEIIHKNTYPYTGRNSYIIPAPRMVKKALMLEEVATFLSLSQTLKGAQKRAIEYLLFSAYTCGLNFKDIALLKRENIDTKLNILTFLRAKSSRERSNPEEIAVELLPIHYHLMKSLNVNMADDNDGYIFPILRECDNDKYKISKRLQTVHRNHDRAIKKVTKKYRLRNNISYQFARHTHATSSDREGVPLQAIGKSMGHSHEKSTDITKRYTYSLAGTMPSRAPGELLSLIPAELL